MAVTIDQKVVEMKFDNRDFEKNTKTTMSTLDKLKSKLGFKGAETGLQNVSKAAQNVKFDNLSNSIMTVQTKFSAMEIVGITALMNITNKAIDAGAALVKSMTIDQVTAGWNKMEQKISNVQTLVNSTGLASEEIEKYLSKLMWYSDETSYGFTDMTQALAQMTSTGGDIRKLVPMITGIANATAFAGKGAAEFSRVMYNLNQSYGSGFLNLMDWKSVSMAGVNSKQLTQELIRAGEELGRIEKGSITIGTFNDSLKDKWADTKVMELAFGRFAELSDAAYEAIENGIELADGSKKTFNTTAEAIDFLADNYSELSVRAFKSAQEAKSFKEAIDATKDAISSDFMKIFSSMLGGYEEQKRIWTNFTEFLYEHLVVPFETLHDYIDKAFNFTGIKELFDKINNNPISEAIQNVNEQLKQSTHTLEEYQNIVNRVWRGDFKNQPYRKGLLEQQGWDFGPVQTLVNLGYQHKITQEEVNAAEQKHGIIVKQETKEIQKQTKSLKDLTDAELKQMGLSEDEIDLFKRLSKSAKKYGMTLEDLIDTMSNRTGHDLLFGNEEKEIKGVFDNLAEALGNLGRAVGEAWANVFDDAGFVNLYMFINRLHQLSEAIREATENEKTMRNLTDTFSGLFSVLKLVSTILSAGFRIAWAIFTTVLKTCGLTVLDFTGMIGRLTTKIVDFIEENNWLIKGIVWLTEQVTKAIKKVYDFIYNWLDAKGIIEKVKKTVNEFTEDWKNFIEGFKTTDNIPKYIIDGLVKGFKKYGGKPAEMIGQIATNIINKFKEIFKIHSPSKVMYALGAFIIAGLVAGLKSRNKAPMDVLTYIGNSLIEIAKGLVNNIVNFFKNLDLGSIIVSAISGAFIYGFLKITKAVEAIAKGITNINGILGAAKNVLVSFKDVLNAAKWKMISSALKDFAISIAILVASIFVLTKLDAGKVWASVGVIAALAVILGGLAALIATLPAKSETKIAKVLLSMIGIGIALSLMAKAFKNVAGIEKLNLGALIAFGGMIVLFLGITAVITRDSSKIVKAGGALLAIGVVFLIMSKVIKSLGKLDEKILSQGMLAMYGFIGMISALLLATKLITGSKNIGKIGGAILSIGVTFLLMAKTVKTLGKMKKEELKQGKAALGSFVGMIGALMFLTRFITGSKNIDKIGPALLGIGGAILLMTLSVKLLGSMKIEHLIQGGIAVGLFGVMVAGLIFVVNKYGKDVGKLGITLTGIAVAIGIMAGAAALLSMLDIKALTKGLVAVGILSGFVSLIILATRGAGNILGTMMGLMAVIIALTASIGILSLIDPTKLKNAVLALSLVMVVFSIMIACAKILEKLDVKSMLTKLGLIIGVIAILSGIIVGLSFINADNAVKTVLSLSALMIAMSTTLFILSKIHMNNKVFAGLLGLVSLIGIVALAVGVLKLMSGVENAAQNAIILSGFMLVLTGVLLATALVGSIYAATGGIAATGLLGLAGILAVLLSVIGILALMNKVPNAIVNINMLTLFMTSMINMLTKLAIVGPLAILGVTALGALIGLMGVILIFATAIGTIMNYIPQLEQFLNKGLGIMIMLAGGIGEMIGAFVSGIAQQIASKLPEIGMNLSQFMLNAMPFIIGAKMVDKKVLTGVGILSAAVIALTIAELIEGIGKFLSGGQSFAKLGTELSTFITNAMPFITMVSTIPSKAMDGVKSLATAILTLTAANILDGLTKWVTGGGSSLEKFGEQLPGLGTSLAGFVTNLGAFTDEQVATVDCAGRAIEALANASSKLPKEGGWVQKILGENSLATFSSELPDVGKNIAAFVANLGTFTDEQVKTADCASKVIVSLADAASKLPKENGFWQKMFGSNSLADFANDMPKVAEGVSKFIQKLDSVKDKADVASSGAEIINSIAELGKQNLKDLTKQLPEFAKVLPDLGDKIKNFIEEVSGFDKESIKTANSNMTLVSESVNNMMTTFKNTIYDNSSSVEIAFEDVATASINRLNSDKIKNDMKTASTNFVKGFADGITNNKNLAETAASNIANDALTAMKNKLNIHSPSRETAKLGSYTGEGFVIGLKKYCSKVYNISSDLGEEAKRGLSKSISKLSNIIDSDMDTSPVIRPVLDLTDINKGANEINSMFGTPSLAMMANLNSINTGIDSRVQNGSSDILNAITKLGNSMSKVKGNTYNINGITYDGDSNVTNAVETLIHAIEVERRV